MSLLRADNLRKSFGGIQAVAGISVTLIQGEIVALIGPNGAGKSTFFNLLNGQTQPDSGHVLLDGRDITARPTREVFHLGIGRSFQVAATFTSMSVRENVQLAVQSRHREIWRFLLPAARSRRTDAEALLHQVGIEGLADRPCGTLTYADLKRLELALALAGAPRLLLMDEPSAGMAAFERAHMMALVQRLARETNLAVLFTEHNMDAVFGTADRILVMDRGALIAEGAPDEIRANALVQAVYLGQDAASSTP